MHDEDILSMSVYSNKSLPAAVVASASYDGDIYIWSLETGSVLSKLNRIESFSTQTTKRSVLPRIPVKGLPGGKVKGKTKGPDQAPTRQTLTNQTPQAKPSVEKLVPKQVNLSALNTPGEEATFGRRLSQSSIRRSTLNLSDMTAIQARVPRTY